MSAAKPSSNQGDLLLWIAGGAIAAVGAAWLVITQPWTGGGADEPEITLALAPASSAATSPALTAEAEAVADDAAALTPEAAPRQPAAHGAARVRGRHADRARGVQRVDAVLARAEERARQRGCARGPDEGRRRPRAPRRDGARSRAFRRRARDRRAHSRHAARTTRAPRLWRRRSGRRSRRCRRPPARCVCPSPKSRASRASRRRRHRRRRRNRRSTPSSRRAKRSRKRWPKAVC